MGRDLPVAARIAPVVMDVSQRIPATPLRAAESARFANRLLPMTTPPMGTGPSGLPMTDGREMLCIFPVVEAGLRPMSSGKHQEIWLEQCQAARTIMLRYGLKGGI